ncbi:hypothetical protein [Methyloversatilis discipulorum]|uniref:hypothetical protein n=1 Tax=Methyloversatilis discipulorum TaxID=1119528 RepID=UPI003F2B06FB
MLPDRFLRPALLATVLAIVAPGALAFSFSEDAKKDAAAAEESRAAAHVLSLPPACLDELRRRKIMIVMGERTGEGVTAEQARFSPHFNSINKRLLKHGIRTYSQQEIRAQIAQAEVDAYFRNDPDAALAASKKMGAQLVMRGTIDSRSAINPVLRIPEVYVSIAYVLMTPGGKMISEASAKAESYSGSDTLGMAGTLIEEQADAVVSTLLGGYCAANPPAGGKKKSK